MTGSSFRNSAQAVMGFGRHFTFASSMCDLVVFFELVIVRKCIGLGEDRGSEALPRVSSETHPDECC